MWRLLPRLLAFSDGFARCRETQPPQGRGVSASTARGGAGWMTPVLRPWADRPIHRATVTQMHHARLRAADRYQVSAHQAATLAYPSSNGRLCQFFLTVGLLRFLW